MKILNLQQFLAMPADTIFSKYAPVYFEDLCIKGDSLGTDDFMWIHLAASYELDTLGREAAVGIPVHPDLETYTRDACFEPDQLFAVWEPQDVELLIKRLRRCIPAPAASAARPGPAPAPDPDQMESMVMVDKVRSCNLAINQLMNGAKSACVQFGGKDYVYTHDALPVLRAIRDGLAGQFGGGELDAVDVKMTNKREVVK
jgi:hypothetical protein